MYSYYLTIVLAPLAAAIIAGLAGKKIGRAGAHWVTIIGVGISCVLSLLVLKNDVRRHICVAGGACLHNRLHA
jgi:NADH-quinone oxidoreductase subunit L